MFLTGFKREDICLPNTNKLSWKQVRLHEYKKIPKAMLKYSMYGETKGHEILAYQTITYCEKILDGVVADDVD